MAIHSVGGQNKSFIDIKSLKNDDLNQNNSLLYFHFKGCPPCKRMDDEVLNQDSITTILAEKFNCYSIYGFDSLETAYRKKYNIKGNPAFVFRDRNDVEIHRIVGFYSVKDFAAEINKATTAFNSKTMDSLFHTEYRNKDFLYTYLKTKDQANQLDSALIFEFIDRLDPKDWQIKKNIEALMHYGYYHGDKSVKYPSVYFDILQRAYDQNLYPELKEDLRCRLIFSINQTLYTYDNNDPMPNDILDQLELYENGEMILLRDLYREGAFAFFTTRYPSFNYRYEKAVRDSDKELQEKLFYQHGEKVKTNSEELNSLAWGIYKGEFNIDVEKGIELIKQAISIENNYNYIDTYAALLYKANRFEDAKNKAEEAILLAITKNITYVETEKLLNDILVKLGK